MKILRIILIYLLIFSETLWNISPVMAQTGMPTQAQIMQGMQQMQQQGGMQWVGPMGGTTMGFSNPTPSSVPPVGDLRNSGGSFGQKGETGGSGAGVNYPGGMSGMYNGITYQIHILGEVKNPGTYRIPASTRLFEALQATGGIENQGSTSHVELRRNGVARSVDLIAFRRYGNLNDNPYLMDNDVIFVPLRGDVVQIEGAIKRPGIYELVGEKNLTDIMKSAGGVTPGISTPDAIKVIRFENNKKEILNVENNDEAKHDFQLKNGDVIVIPHFLTANKKFDYNLATLPGDNRLFYPSFEERVFVLGAVQNPGPQPYNPYSNVGQYLTMAGGVTKMAKRNKMQVITSQGTRSKAKPESEISPGDSIIVPERYMPAETMITLMVGISASILGITTTVLTLTR